MVSKIPGVKKPAAVNGTAAEEKINGASAADSDDPIGQSLDARDKKLGGLNENVTDIEAKKKNIPVYRAPKLPTISKGATLLEFVKDDSKD